MFLLIRDPLAFRKADNAFTFQYVSINTRSRIGSGCGKNSLHSNMFLLIRMWVSAFFGMATTLHSNMFLLIRDMAVILDKLQAFTFQYVSINTKPFDL